MFHDFTIAVNESQLKTAIQQALWAMDTDNKQLFRAHGSNYTAQYTDCVKFIFRGASGIPGIPTNCTLEVVACDQDVLFHSIRIPYVLVAAHVGAKAVPKFGTEPPYSLVISKAFSLCRGLRQDLVAEDVKRGHELPSAKADFSAHLKFQTIDGDKCMVINTVGKQPMRSLILPDWAFPKFHLGSGLNAVTQLSWDRLPNGGGRYDSLEKNFRRARKWSTLWRQRYYSQDKYYDNLFPNDQITSRVNLREYGTYFQVFTYNVEDIARQAWATPLAKLYVSRDAYNINELDPLTGLIQA